MPRLPIVLSTAVAVALPGVVLPAVADAADGKRIKGNRVAVDTISDRPDTNPGDGICRDRKGRCSLRAAIDEANTRDSGLRIALQANRKFALKLQGAGEDGNRTGDLDVRRNVTIVGNNAIVSAGRLDRAFQVFDGVRLTIGKTRIANGAPPAGQSGGAILSSGRVELKGGKTIKNAVTGDGASGGAIRNEGGTVLLKDTRVNNNSAPANGGAVASTGGNTYLRRTSLLVNRAGSGAGLWLDGDARANVRDSTIDRNAAAVSGGGVWLSRDGGIGLADTAVTRNTAGGGDAGQGGGGLATAGGNVRVDRGAFGGNAAGGANGSGGAILNGGARVLLFGVELRMNNARRAGGAVAAIGGQTSLGRATLNGNAAGDGGALHVTGDGVTDVANSTVAGNTAAGEGGGLWNSATGRMVVRDTAVTGNAAAGNAAGQGGGGLFNDGGTVTVERGVVADNRATGTAGVGAGLLNARGRLTVTGTELRTNAARSAGGALETNAGTTSLVSVRATDNSAANGAALHVSGAGTLDVRDAEVSRNAASVSGGAVWNAADGSVTVARTTMLGNRAGGNDAGHGGGALYNEGRLSVDGGQLADNQATGTNGTGGGVLNAGRGTFTIGGAAIQANRATVAGGGIWAAATATTTVRVTTISGNAAPSGADLFNQPPGGRFTVDGRAVEPTT